MATDLLVSHPTYKNWSKSFTGKLTITGRTRNQLFIGWSK